MSILLHHRCRKLLGLVLVLCLMLPASSVAAHLKDDSFTALKEYAFSVLIMGDSQMAGAGWADGYANCISENYPNAQIVNLAQSGKLLANGEIHEQWEFYLKHDYPMADFILLDGGINDLPYIQREEFKDTGMSLVSEALSMLLEHIHAISPDSRIIYITMPPFEEWKDSGSGPPAYDIQQNYWKQLNIIASAYDYVTVLDLFSLNPFRFPCAECYQEFLADSIHLSEAGYRKTFEYIDNVLMVHLAEKLKNK